MRNKIFITAILLIALLCSCSSFEYKNEIELELDTKDRFKIECNTADLNMKWEDAMINISSKSNEELDIKIAFLGEKDYMDSLTEASEVFDISYVDYDRIVEDVNTRIAFFNMKDNEAAAMFWIEDTGIGTLVASWSGEQDLTQTLQHLSIQVIQSPNKCKDPAADLNLSNSTKVTTPTDVDDVPGIISEGNKYWSVPDGYNETYSCEYFYCYENNNYIVYPYFTTSTLLLEYMAGQTDMISSFSNIKETFTKVGDITLNVYQCVYNESYKTFVVNATNSPMIYIEISNRYGYELSDDEIREILNAFL